MNRRSVIFLALGIAATCAFVIAGYLRLSSKVSKAVVEEELSLVELYTLGSTTVFPRSGPLTDYGNSPNYFAPLIAPSGRTLYAVRRGTRGELDLWVRRGTVGGQFGDEESVPLPFDNIFQFGVSPNEEWTALAGRIHGPGIEYRDRDGIYLVGLKDGTASKLAPYDALDSGVRSIGVTDERQVVFERSGTVMAFELDHGVMKLAASHPGSFPSFTHDGRGSYVFWNDGWIILRTGQEERTVLREKKVVGAMRVSPGGRFVSFGVELFGTTLKVCDLANGACAYGANYWDRIAGRETFWRRD